MAKGVVSRYSEDKGIGYITQDDGSWLFFERESIDMDGYKSLVPGDHVSFEVEEAIRGLVAKKIEKK